VRVKSSKTIIRIEITRGLRVSENLLKLKGGDDWEEVDIEDRIDFRVVQSN